MTDERILLKRIRDGDRNAFRELVESHRESMFFLALDLTGNRQDAEDLLQEVFIKAFRSIGNFRGESKISTWLYRITVNTHVSSNRKKMVYQESLNENEEMPLQNKGKYSEKNSYFSERYTEGKLIQLQIEKALQKLTSREKSVFVLRQYRELSLKEIGTVLNIAEGTVKSLLFRAIKRLQSELAFYRSEFGLED